MLTIGKRVGNAVRLAEVIQVLVRHGFADLVRRASLHESIPLKLLRGMRLIEAPSGEPETRGQRLRAVLTELGPTFLKFGQILSTRPDLIGNDISMELRQLQDQVAPTPFEKMESVVKGELGDDVEVLFSDFTREPVASASLGQVYRARLKDGAEVAVKVQRPGIEAVIESDLGLMRWIAEWVADHVEEIVWLDPVGVVDEFTRSIRRELDFNIERRVIDRVRHNFEDAPELLVPKTYPELSARRVLTMDWVDGARIDAVDQYAARNCDPKTVAARGCEILCRQVFEHRLFHADPHPGNIFITRDNQLALLDYGMIGHLERADAAMLADLLRSMFREDAETCVEGLLAMTTSGEPEDRRTLEHEVADYVAFEGQAVLGGALIAEGIERMIEILRGNRLQLAPRFSLLLKALATIESVGHVLDPDMDMLPILKPYVERLVAGRYAPNEVMIEAQRELAVLYKLARQLPSDLQQVLRKLRQGRLKIQVNQEYLDRLGTIMDRASNRVTFGLITGALIIGSSFLMTTEAAANKIGLVGYVVAGVFGLAAMISILRSRNY